MLGELQVGRTTFKGILLHKPHYELSGSMSMLDALQMPIAIGSILTGGRYRGGALHAYGWIIPVAHFDANWEEGAIGDAVRHYAPHVFDNGERPALKYNRG